MLTSFADLYSIPELPSQLGRGCFGSVVPATHIDGRGVAVKLIGVGSIAEGLPRAVVREICAMQAAGWVEVDGVRVRHPHIVPLYHVGAVGSAVALAIERADCDLSSRLSSAFSPIHRMGVDEVRTTIAAVLKALSHCHSCGIVHRDVKTSNILLKEDGGDRRVMLADFGLARPFAAKDDARSRPMSHEVVSKWYRAPELLMGCDRYGGEVDVWAAGCIFAELIGGCGPSVLFPGDGDIDQLARIFECLGVPDEQSWPSVVDLPDWGKMVFHPAEEPRMTLPSLFGRPNDPQREAAVDLLQRMLVLDPTQRISCRDALAHPYFTM